jgi:acyl-CoA synthetase (AMP-forming)/AMP-acid ligase II
LNIVEIFEQTARQRTNQLALVDKSRRFTFARLWGEVDRQACRLRSVGFEPGATCLVLLRNSAEFVAAVFALFKIGVVPILIDPGMGLGRFLKVVDEVSPEALLGIPRAFALRKLAPKPFRNVKATACWGHFPDIADLRRGRLDSNVPVAEANPGGMAAVLFTSGSTGPAKGVVYTHEIFCRQVEVLRTVYQFRDDDIDLPGFPLFGLFSAALGVTGVVPELDPSRPAQCRPGDLVAQIHEHGVTSLQGSPAIWKRVAAECQRRRITLPTVRRLITFGAPIPFDFIESWREIAPYAKIHTPYGATEALPVTDIEAEELLTTKTARNHEGAGLCVGRPLDLNEVRVVARDGLDPEDRSVQPLPPGKVGEIAVRGPVVTESYFRNPEATAVSKVRSQQGIWHLMGDLGYFDSQGRLWLVGRKSHVVPATPGEEPLYPLPGEALVLPHPEVERAALVDGREQPVLIVEKKTGSRSRDEVLARECLALLHQVPCYKGVEQVMFHPALPVDPRHNAKIHREELSIWAKRVSAARKRG